MPSESASALKLKIKTPSVPPPLARLQKQQQAEISAGEEDSSSSFPSPFQQATSRNGFEDDEEAADGGLAVGLHRPRHRDHRGVLTVARAECVVAICVAERREPRFMRVVFRFGTAMASKLRGNSDHPALAPGLPAAGIGGGI